MSKILKVVDGKHYVKGGPECPKCEGDGLYTIWTGGHKIRLRGETGGCWDCDGTGLQPVEEWPDARKAKWIWDNGFGWSPDKFQNDEGKMEIEINVSKNGCDIYFGYGFDLSQALTAAVIAVAEVE